MQVQIRSAGLCWLACLLGLAGRAGKCGLHGAIVKMFGWLVGGGEERGEVTVQGAGWKDSLGLGPERCSDGYVGVFTVSSRVWDRDYYCLL